MTSSVAIKVNSNHPPYIVIGADTQISICKEGGMIEKELAAEKIWFGNWGALVRSGGAEDTEELEELKELIMGRKNKPPQKDKLYKLIDKAITPNERGERIFDEISELNRKLLKKGHELEDLFDFVFATVKPEVCLWYVDAFGNVYNDKEYYRVFPGQIQKLEYFALGSGHEKIDKYLQKRASDKKNPLDIHNPPIRDLFLAVREALHYAETDAFTGGIDLAVVTNRGAKCYGKRIRDRLEREEIDEFENIAEELAEELERN